MSSIQDLRGGRPGAQGTVRGSTIVLRGLLWIGTVLGSRLKDTYVLAGKIPETCGGIGNSQLIGPVTVLGKRNTIYEEHLMAFLTGKRLPNSCR